MHFTNRGHKQLVRQAPAPRRGGARGQLQYGDHHLVAEYERETGIILLNDFALGDLLVGAPGSRSAFRDQGFTGTRLMCTPEELKALMNPANGKKLAG